MTHKLLPGLIAAALCMCLCGCEAAPTPAATPEPTPSPTAAPPTPTATPAPTPTPTPQPPKKADYLNYKFAYSITGGDLGDKLTALAAKECSAQADDAQAEDWIYKGMTPGADSTAATFLTWCGDCSGLIDAGLLLRSTDLRDIFVHLTEVNGLTAAPLTGATQFGGSQYTAQTGDLLFWTDDDGADVNAGIITLAKGYSVQVAICSSESKVASFELSNSRKGEHYIKSCTLVSMRYPCNEQLIFLFLVNQMKYTNAVACGIMANIYWESSFEPNVEELDYTEGYGICQWTGYRRAALEEWCLAQELDHSRLSSQLAFMEHELLTDAAGDLDWRLHTLGNTEDDAVKAGDDWCMLYENPGEDVAEQRRESAKIFFAAYSGHPYM